MLRWFKKDTYPELDTIRESPIRDKYFYRVAHYHWMDDQQEQIVVQHPAEAKMITMDDWPQVVFLDAIGNLTVEQYIFRLAKRFPRREINSDFDKSILHQLEQLTELGIVVLSNDPVTLPPEFAQSTTG